MFKLSCTALLCCATARIPCTHLAAVLQLLHTQAMTNARMDTQIYHCLAHVQMPPYQARVSHPICALRLPCLPAARPCSRPPHVLLASGARRAQTGRAASTHSPWSSRKTILQSHPRYVPAVGWQKLAGTGSLSGLTVNAWEGQRSTRTGKSKQDRGVALLGRACAGTCSSVLSFSQPRVIGMQQPSHSTLSCQRKHGTPTARWCDLGSGSGWANIST